MCAAALAASAVVAQTPRTPVPQVRMNEGFSFLPLDEAVAPQKAPALAGEATDAAADGQSLDFTLAFGVYGALYFVGQNGGPLPAGTTYYQAFALSEANRKLYAGKTITSINIVSPMNSRLSSTSKYVNDITDVTVFLTHGLDKEFFYTQKGKLGTDGYTQYKIELDTPYVIEEDKPLYIGYYAQTVSQYDYYLVVDGVARESLDGGYCDAVTGSAAPKWNNIAQDYGNLCIGATIVGDNLPENGVSMFGIELPTYTAPGEPFSFDIGFIGAAANEAKSVEIEYTIGNQTPETLKIPFQEQYYLGFNEPATYTISKVVCNEVGAEVPFSVKITKVNDVPNVSEDNQASGTFQCFDPSLGFTRRFVVEEGTGTWCGYCPQGFVMMQYLRENYPTEFIRIAIHASSSRPDQMEVATTSSVINALFEGFPQAWVNRSYNTMLGYQGVDVNQGLADYYEANKDVPSIADVDLAPEFATNGRSIEIPTAVKVAIDVNNNDRYRLAYYITEDNVGPYSQANYYSGGQMGAMGGWENEPNPVPDMMFEDVVRRLVGNATGVSGSLPEEIKAGETYEYSTSASIANVTGDTFFVTAMVIDSNTLEIVNAKQVELRKPGGVTDVDGNGTALDVRGTAGAIVFGGEYASAAVYNVAGQLVATAAGEASVALPAGLYIVKADGATAKVVVK